jgi:hypothetical protein
MLFHLLDYFTAENGGTVVYRRKRPLTKYHSFSCSSTFRIKRRGSGDQVTALMLVETASRKSLLITALD